MSPDLLAFFVEGDPVAQGSGRVVHHGGRAVMAMTTGKLMRWRREIGKAAKAARAAHERPVAWMSCNDPVFLVAAFRFRRKPKRWKSMVDVFKATTPDLDKLVRAVGDALEQAGILKNDSRIVAVLASKRWDGSPGVSIELARLNERTAAWVMQQGKRDKRNSGASASTATG